MNLISLSEENFEDTLLETVRVLSAGGVVIVPTDTVYGLIAGFDQETALDRIFSIKRRSLEKKLPLLVKDIQQAKDLCRIMTPVERFLVKTWPGAVTAVLPLRAPSLSANFLSADNTVALRIPNHLFLQRLLSLYGKPIAATSANLSGEESLVNIQTVTDSFRDQTPQPDLLISEGDLPRALPSTIIDFSKSRPRIIREGDFTQTDLESYFS